MKIQKIRLKDGDTIADILKVFSLSDADKIVFGCPRNFALGSDITFLKKLKKTALENEKKVAFMVRQTFIKDSIEAQDIETFVDWKSIEGADGDPQNINDFFGNIEAKKNKKKTKIKSEEEKKEEKDEDIPFFSSKRIENTGMESSLRSHVFFGFLFVLFLLGVLFYWISPSSTIWVKPKVSVIPFTQNMIVRVGDGQIPDEENILPSVDAIFVETEIEGEEVFPAGDLRYEVTNAKGKVTLFNETRKPKRLVPSRLQSPDGSIFRFKREVEIPPATDAGPGTLVVDIEADGFINEDPQKPIGSKGNIEAGTKLIFPALSEQLREQYYAKANKGPLVGGSTLTRYFVAQEDFDRASEVFLNVSRTQGIEQLSEEIKTRSAREGRPYEFVDDPRMMQAELLDVNYPVELLGQESQTFTLSGKVRIFGVVFDQGQVLQHLESKLKKTQDGRKKLIRLDDTSVGYRILDAEHLQEEGWVKLSVSVSGIESLDIEDESRDSEEWRQHLLEEIQQKSVLEARAILLNDPEIESVEKIKISPFWIRHLPALTDQIHFRAVGIE